MCRVQINYNEHQLAYTLVQCPTEGELSEMWWDIQCPESTDISKFELQLFSWLSAGSGATCTTGITVTWQLPASERLSILKLEYYLSTLFLYVGIYLFIH